MHPIRILLALSGLKRSIFAGLVEHEDGMEVVATIDDCEHLLAEVERTDAELVVLEVGPEGVPAVCDEFLYSRCRSRVLAIERDADRGFLYQLVPTKVPLGELGRQRLIDAIRTPATAWATER